MDDQPLFDELLRVAGALGVAVRVEPFETPARAGGGPCVLRGERLILLDAHGPLRERVAVLSELETDTIFMIPEVRETIDAMRESWAGGKRTRA
jgi:hypothetical protein